MNPNIPYVQSGDDSYPADGFNRLVDAATREFSGGMNSPLGSGVISSVPEDQSGVVTGVLTGTLGFGGTAGVAVYQGTSPSGGSATGETIEDCWTWLLQSGWKLLNGYHVDVDRSTKKIIGCRECPVEDE